MAEYASARRISESSGSTSSGKSWSLTPDQAARAKALAERYFDPDNGPEPEVCPYCGNVMRREAVRNADGEFAFWDPRDPVCGCDGEREEALMRQMAREAEIAAERERQLDMWFAGLVKACLAPGCMARRFGDRDFATFNAEEAGQRMAKNAAMRYVARFPEMEQAGRGLYVSGPCGTGKTHLAMAVRRALWRDGVRRILARTVTEMLADVRACYQPGGGSEEEVLSLYKSARLLILDDMGKEKPTTWAMTTLYEILNARYLAKRPTIVTTNFALDELPRVMAVDGSSDKGAAIADRFRECMIMVPMDGTSMRGRRAS